MHRNEWKWKQNNPKPTGHCKSSAKGKVQAYLKQKEKSQINNLTLQLKQLEKEEMKNLRVNRREKKS